MTTCRYSVIPHIRIRPLYREHFSGEVTVPQNSLGPTNQSSSTHHWLPHFNHILPPTKSVFDYLLERQENPEIRGRYEFDYIAVTAYSPFHRGEGQHTPAWIITRMGIDGEGKMSEEARIKPGTAVRIFDQELSEKNYGFERVWIFGVIGRPHSREPGYHLFWLTPHLMTITEDPIPVRISAALIAIPNHLLPEEYHLDQLHECSLGQRMLHGTPCIQPPLRPWDRDRVWKHPMMNKVEQWHLGLMPNLEKEWSQFHDKD